MVIAANVSHIILNAWSVILMFCAAGLWLASYRFKHYCLTARRRPKQRIGRPGQSWADDNMQRRRLRLRSASQGSAPAAQRHSTATNEKQERPNRNATGNSVSPLEKTYHGGLQRPLETDPAAAQIPRCSKLRCCSGRGARPTSTVVKFVAARSLRIPNGSTSLNGRAASY